MRQSRFADARTSDDRDQAAVPLGLRSLQHPFELGQGIPAADERSVETRGRIGSLAEGKQAVGTDRVALALQLEGCQPLGVDRIAHEPVRRLGEEDLARLRVLLEAGRRVGRVAGNEVAIGNEALSGDRSRVQARARREGDAIPPLEVVVQPGERVPHLDRRAHGAQRIVLVKLGQAEDRHHRVADELRELPSVPLDDGPHPLEEGGHHLVQRLRVEPLPEPGRVDDVGEEDRHHSAEALGGLLGQRLPAGQAEPGSLGILLAADPADRHGPSLGPVGAMWNDRPAVSFAR